MSRLPLKFTMLTSITPKLLSKSFSLTKDTKLEKLSSANMSEGTSELISCRDLVEFNNHLSGMTGSQALVYGVAPGHPTATIRAADKLRPGDIARTKVYFQFADAPGIMMLDHDGTCDGLPISAEELHEQLIRAVPELADAGMLWRVSASSCITNAATGETLNGIKGQRLYIPVQNAALIPEAGKALVDLLWASGMGWTEVGKAGQTLMRTIVDASVWQANRLDFAGPPELSSELRRAIPYSVYFGDQTELFDLRRIKANAETICMSHAAQAVAVSDAKPASSKARAAYISAKVAGMAERRGISEEAATAVLQEATERNVLGGDFELLAQDGTIVTVGHILTQTAKWDGKNFADPLEPEYGDWNRTVARAHLRGGTSPTIRSFAHGGIPAPRQTGHCRATTQAIGGVGRPGRRRGGNVLGTTNVWVGFYLDFLVRFFVSCR